MAVFSKELGLDPNSGERDLFRWFLASILLGKPIQQNVAKRAWQTLIEHGVDTPEALLETGWRGLVDLLDEGHYVRYDESTADYLLDDARLLIARYHGRVSEILDSAKDAADVERRLEQFRGIGPVTAGIFLRDVDEEAHFGSGGDGRPVTLTRAELESEPEKRLKERAALLRLHHAASRSKEELVDALAPYYAGE